MTPLLTDLHDPALEIPADTTTESIVKEEVERLARLTAIMGTTVTIPRRLGADASPEELAVDKKRGRRVTHALAQCLGAWNGGPFGYLPETEAIRQESAVLLWGHWWEEHQVWLGGRLCFIATWARKSEVSDERWAKSAVVKLQNEQRWIAYALRE